MNDDNMFEDNRYPYVYDTWLVSFELMLLEQGIYSRGDHTFVDIDKIVEDVDEVLYDITHQQKGL